MTYDYSMYYYKLPKGWDLCCNLIKGDSEHELSLYMHYKDSCFKFIHVLHDGYDYESESLIDHTVLDDGELFQEALVFDKNKYSCTFEEMVSLQNEMKRFEKENVFNPSPSRTNNYYFNI